MPRIQSVEVHGGDNAVKFGAIDRYEDSSFEVTINVDEESTISFYALKDNNKGNLRFYIDGSYGLYTSSTISAWTKYTYNISAGVRTLKWTYETYSSTAENVYIDDITISP